MEYRICRLTQPAQKRLYPEDAGTGLPVKFHLYGNMEDYDAVAKDKNIIWHGFMNADDFIKQVRGNFGLVWDGDSLEECHGDFGSYLKYNTPHKASFYLRAGLPIIVWKESAIAPLVEEKGVGFAINSLKELPGRLAAFRKKNMPVCLPKQNRWQ